MKKLLIILGSIVFVLLTLVMIAEAARPKQPDFTPYYTPSGKKPIDLLVFNEQADSLFKGSKIERISADANVVVDSVYFKKEYSPDPANCYMRIAGSTISFFDEEEASASLLSFVRDGNTAVLCMNVLPQTISDSIGVQIVSLYDDKPKPTVVYTAKKPKEKVTLLKGCINSEIILKNNDSTRILGYQNLEGRVTPSLIEVKHGNGRFIISNHPEVFSNYYLLQDQNYKYVEAIASAIPQGTIYWQTGVGSVKDDSRGLIDSFLKEPAFRSFWYLGLLTLVLFAFFNARRKQRIVPVIPPVQNSTVDFTRTIGNLYHQEGNNDDIIDKKIIYFLEGIRREYFIDTYNLNNEFVDKLHAKTGKSKEDIYTAVELIKRHRQNLGSSEADLLAINNAIEKLRL